MVNIGDVEIPIVFIIDEETEAEVDEINPHPAVGDSIDQVAVKHEPSVQSITIEGYVNEELHSSNLSIPEQKEKIRDLRNNEILDNSFNYREYKGHLLIEDVDFADNADSKIVNEVAVEARYLPWPKFYPDNEPS